MVQADNTWRTLVTALAVGRLDGTLALLSRHTTEQEFVAADEDVDPDAVLLSPGVAVDLALHRPGASTAGPRRLVARRPPGPRAGALARWGGHRPDVGLHGSGQGRRPVRGRAALRRPGHHRGRRAPARGHRRSPRPALLGRGRVLRALPASAARRHGADARPLGPGGGGRPHGGPRGPLDHVRADDGPADGGCGASGRRPRPGGDDRRRRADGRRRAGPRRECLGTRILRVFGMSEALGHTTSRPGTP